MTSCLISSTYVELRVDGAIDALEDPSLGVAVWLISILSMKRGGAFSSIAGKGGGATSCCAGFGLK